MVVTLTMAKCKLMHKMLDHEFYCKHEIYYNNSPVQINIGMNIYIHSVYLSGT